MGKLISTSSISLYATLSLFSYMRRMIWGYKNSWQANSSSRLDTRQAVMALLEGAGRPLSTLEIRKKLENDRGLNSHFRFIHKVT